VKSDFNRIELLPDNVKQKIAAGEVIEGPSSIVKELLENSIDADAHLIEIKIFDSGLKKIFIQDDGVGIYYDDLPLAIEEHATSKIRDIYDIESVASYGFRGEALSSISSVSNFTIFSRNRSEDVGRKLESRNDKVSLSDYNGKTGTVIIVENLFYNIPARKKFLKSKNWEQRLIREVIIKSAIAHPEISYIFDVDDKRYFTLNAVDSLEERLRQVYGNKLVEGLYFDEIVDLKVRVSGFFSSPNAMRASRNMQFLYINNRPVEHKHFSFLLSRIYEAISQRGKYPVAIVFVDIDPQLVDINIHPSKREVKLFDVRYIESLIFHLGEKILDRVHGMNTELFLNSEIQKQEYPAMNLYKNVLQEKSVPIEKEIKLDFSYEKSSTNETSLKESYPTDNSYNEKYKTTISNVLDENSVAQENLEILEKSSEDFKIVGVVFNTYIIIEMDGSLQFIDFHAAHERILFDELIKSELNIESQKIAFPEIVELPVEDYKIVIENLDDFAKVGFDLDDFSDSSIVIQAIPQFVRGGEPKKFLLDIIDSIKNDEELLFMDSLKKRVYASVACHSARRAGDIISNEEISLLVKKIYNGQHEKRCPHGRPYVYNLSKNDLERIFKR